MILDTLRIGRNKSACLSFATAMLSVATFSAASFSAASIITGLFTVATLAGNTVAVAGTDDTSRPAPLPPSPALQDEAALQFAKTHEAELAKLLEFLKKKRPEDYRTAVEEIDRVRLKLENIRKRDEQLYDVELAIWKNDSRLRLLTAELSTARRELTDADRERLRSLVLEEQELLVKRLQREKALAAARLESLSDQLKKREGNRETAVNRSLKQWENRIVRGETKSKADTKSKASKSNKSSDQPAQTEDSAGER